MTRLGAKGGRENQLSHSKWSSPSKALKRDHELRSDSASRACLSGLARSDPKACSGCRITFLVCSEILSSSSIESAFCDKQICPYCDKVELLGCLESSSYGTLVFLCLNLVLTRVTAATMQ